MARMSGTSTQNKFQNAFNFINKISAICIIESKCRNPQLQRGNKPEYLKLENMSIRVYRTSMAYSMTCPVSNDEISYLEKLGSLEKFRLV